MDNKKIGAFICELRKEKNLSQYDLADLIHISRESISKWERGIGKPDKNCLEMLSKIFNVSTDELILGRKIENSDESKKLALEMYEDINKKQKLLKILFICLGLILLLFFMYYFINNYNSINAYTINYSDDEVVINNGIFVTTKEKMYFYLGNISSNNDIKYIKIYYKDKSNNEKLIYKTDDKSIMLYDYYGYDVYFDYNQMDYILKNMYLDLEYDDITKTIKLELVKDFSNNKIRYDSEKELTNIENNNSEFDVNKIKLSFKYKDGAYTYKKNNIEIVYFEDSSLINMYIKNEKSKEEWYYYINQDMLSYTEYVKDVVKNSFDYSNNNYSCLIDNCTNQKEKKDFFFDFIHKILI